VTTQLYNLPLGWSMAMNGVNKRVWDSYDPAVREFLAKQITAMADGIWKDAETESVEGINCNIGAQDCAKGKKGAMTLVPVSDADRAEVRSVLQNVVLKRWAQRCGAECVTKWNETVGKVVSLTAAP
ncbi:MAG TPA: transporter, partial [Bradyrhizobium sp.]|nr:transporter [Bradyrhizobium sp.]